MCSKTGKTDKINRTRKILAAPEQSNTRPYPGTHTEISKKSNRPIDAKFQGHHKTSFLRTVVGESQNAKSRPQLAKAGNTKAVGSIQFILECATQIGKFISVVISPVDLFEVRVIISGVGRHFIPKYPIAIPMDCYSFPRNCGGF